AEARHPPSQPGAPRRSRLPHRISRPPVIMPLLTLANAELAYGELPLLDRASFAMEAGARIGVIGRNGTGKSSLLGIIAGKFALEDGELRRNTGLRIAYVPQEPVDLFSDEVEKHKLEEYQ